MISWVKTQVIAVASAPESGGFHPLSPDLTQPGSLHHQDSPDLTQPGSLHHQDSPERTQPGSLSSTPPVQSRRRGPVDLAPGPRLAPRIILIHPDGTPGTFPTGYPGEQDGPLPDPKGEASNRGPSAQLQVAEVRVPSGTARNDKPGSPVHAPSPDPHGQGAGEELGWRKGDAKRVYPLSQLVEHPGPQVISGKRDVFVAGRDLINHIESQWVILEARDTVVLDEHQSLYNMRLFGPSVGTGASSGGRGSSGGGFSAPQRAWARSRPALMLGGHTAVTKFVGRTAELKDLRAWYEQPARISVLLVHGPAGQGKTRLTREFARRLALRDKRVVIRETIPLTEVSLRQLTQEDESPGHRNGARRDDLLLLVDEADLWPAARLRKLLLDMATTPCRRVRLLMTGRSAAEWWPPPVLSPSLPDLAWDDLFLKAPDLAGLRELAVAAGSSHAKRLKWNEPPALPEELWQGLNDCPPLSVELLVLARMHAAEAGRPLPQTLHEAAEIVLLKEVRFWEQMHGAADLVPGSADYRIRLDPSAMRRAVYAATLIGPLGETAARRVVDLAALGCALNSQQVIDDHARCYPDADSRYLMPLPACLAEEFLGLLVPGPVRGPGTLLRDRWSVNAPFRILGLLDPGELEDEKARRETTARAALVPDPPGPDLSGLTFGPQHRLLILRLIRAAVVWPHLAERQLFPLAENYPRALVRAEGALSELLNIRARPSTGTLAALGRAADETFARDSHQWLAARNTLQQLAGRENPLPVPEAVVGRFGQTDLDHARDC